MTGKLFDITFENIFSFRDSITLSLQGVDSDSKPENYDILGNEIVLKAAVVYGANGSGKTNIIKFLDAFLGKLKEAMDSDKVNGRLSFFEPFLLDKTKNRKNSISGVTWRFLLEINGELRLYKYEVKFNSQSFLKEVLSYQINGESVLLFEKNTDYPSGISNTAWAIDRPSISEGSITPTRLLLNLFLSNNEKDVTPAAEFLAGIEFANGYNQRMFDKMWDESKLWLQGDPLHVDMLEDFLKHVDVQFRRVVIPDQRNASPDDLIFVHTVYNNKNEIAGSAPFSIAKESAGTYPLFLLGVKVIRTIERGYPLFIDELDSSFHSFVTKFIVRMFQDKRINRNGAQLILTSHNITLMDEKLLRRDQVWFTSKDKKGASELYSLADFDDVREDTRFIEWYMASKFGGVPQIDFSMISLFEHVQTDC